MKNWVAPTKQIWSAGADTGAWAIAWIQTTPTVEAPKSNNRPTATNQSGQADVGTGAVAWMPNQLPNYYSMANQPVDKKAEIDAIKAGATKQPNTQSNTWVQTPVATPTPTKTPTPRRTQKSGGTPVQQSNWRDYSQLRNADVNLSQYWDDSSAQNYNNQELWWWENQKYTGEGVKTSNVNYDSNATLENLDPNYQYWWNAQLANSNDAWYIARRNDTIASALYNAGLTSINDVRNFLNSQKWFQDSDANERENTIMSVRKRLWDITWEQNKNVQISKTDKQPQGNQNSPEMNLSNDGTKTSTLYWKVTADTGTPVNWIKGEADPNAIQATINMARENNYKALQKMNSYDIAVSMSAGTDPYGSQAMADLAQFDPAKYQEIQQQLKNLQSMEDVNNIAQGGKVNKTAQIESMNDTVNSDINSRALNNSNDRSYNDTLNLVTTKMSSSGTAQSATQEMLNLNSQMADLQEKMDKLPQEAKKAFKWDVPQYIVDAFIANRSAQYQSEMNKLQSRYNSAIDLYKTELSQKQWEAEMDLKQRQFQQQINQQNWSNAFQTAQQQWTQFYQGQQLKFNNIKTDSKGRPYLLNADGTFQYLTDATYTQALQQQVKQGVDSLNAIYQDWMDWGQCEAFTDNFNSTVYGATMLPRDAQWNVIQNRTYTTAEEKASYVNTAMPTVGTTAVFNYWPTANVSDAAKKYWHTMLVTGYDADTGMITLKWSNKNGDEKVYTQTMSLNDFYSKWGVGFWDPSKDALLQAQSWAIATQNPGAAMTPVFDELIANASTEWKLNTLATAEAMYNTLSELRDNGSLHALIETGDIKKVLASFDQKKFWTDDGGSVFADQLQKIISKKSLNSQSQIALNKLYMLVEMKLRKESGAAISSSEWLSNFQMMLPQAWENKDVQYSKLWNWDDVIKKYARMWWMTSQQYVPIFKDGSISTRQTR